jgi:hypothetical protein
MKTLVFQRLIFINKEEYLELLTISLNKNQFYGNI